MSTTQEAYVSADVHELRFLVADFKPIPEIHNRLFTSPPGTLLLPIERLAHSRVRPDGVRSAAVRMWSAFEGGLTPRAPLSVKPTAEGTWLVLDGNSTLAIVRLSGWMCVPCLPAASSLRVAPKKTEH